MATSGAMRSSIVSLLLLALALAGCGTGHSSGGTEASLAKEYASIKELKQASTAVVDVTASNTSHEVPAASEGSSGITATVTDLTVNQVLQGSVGGSRVIQLRQVGTSDDESAEDQPAVTSNNRYVLFVQPFTFGANSPSTGQYANTGANIAYKIDGLNAHLVIPASSSKLPAK